MLKSIKKPFWPLIIKYGNKKMQNHFTETPILIGGCARSGTSLLQIILSAHPNIFVFPDEIAAFSIWEEEETDNPEPIRIDKLYREALKYKFPKEADRWCSKAPSNILHIEKILNYLDNDVKIIHIVRDVRDVVLSKHPTKPNEYWVKPERWLNDVKEGLKYKEHPNVFTLKYEDLVQQYNKTVKQLCNFIGIDFMEEMNEWVKNKKINKSKAIFGEIADIYSSSIGKWKKDENTDYIEQVLNKPGIVDLLETLEYE